MIKPIKLPTSGVRQRTKRAEGARVAFSALAWVGFCREFMAAFKAPESRGAWMGTGRANNHVRPHLCDGRVAVKLIDKLALNTAQQPHPHKPNGNPLSVQKGGRRGHLKITVLWPSSSTRCSLCHFTALANTWLSVSRPKALRSSTVLL